MRTPAETRTFYPVAPGTTYKMFFCDGVKICDDLERTGFVADSDTEALDRAVAVMRSRPGHEVGVLDRLVGRGHSVWIADIGASGDRMETDDAVDAAMSLHRELHGCGRQVA